MTAIWQIAPAGCIFLFELEVDGIPRLAEIGAYCLFISPTYASHMGRAVMKRKIVTVFAVVALLAAYLLHPPSAFAGLLVYGPGFVFTVQEPTKWRGDIKSASQWGANIIFYKQGQGHSLSDPAAVVIRVGVFYKGDEETSKDLEFDMNQYRSKYPNVAFKDIDGIKSRYKAWPKLFYVPGTFYEYVTYLNPGPEHPQLISISMNTNKTAATADELHAYQAVIQSFSLLAP